MISIFIEFERFHAICANANDKWPQAWVSAADNMVVNDGEDTLLEPFEAHSRVRSLETPDLEGEVILVRADPAGDPFYKIVWQDPIFGSYIGYACHTDVELVQDSRI